MMAGHGQRDFFCSACAPWLAFLEFHSTIEIIRFQEPLREGCAFPLHGG